MARLQAPTRRELLRAGVASMVGLTLPRLLQAADRGPARSCIFIMLEGGPSHIDTLDPKPNAPVEIRGAYRPIASRVPGIQVCEMLPRLAQWTHHCCILRSLSHTISDHIGGTHATLSGQSDGSRANNTPYFGSVLAKVRPSLPGIPSYAWLHNLRVGTMVEGRHESGGLLGAAYAPFRIGRDLDNPSSPSFRVRAFDAPEGSSTQDIAERFHLLQRLHDARGTPPTPQATDFARFQERAFDLVTSPQARRAFDVDEEPSRVRDRYGRHQLGQYCLMARRLIEAGVRLVSMSGCPGPLPGDPARPYRQVWDMHDVHLAEVNGHMFDTGLYGLGRVLPLLDQAFTALLEDLHHRGLLESTLVVLVGEFGRSPRFESQGRGRAHWPACYSGLLAGGGVRGGMVYGKSDRIGAFVAEGQAIPPEMFGATIYHALGIPPETRPDPRNLGYRVSPEEPLREIF
jgi:hypothetical protein